MREKIYHTIENCEKATILNIWYSRIMLLSIVFSVIPLCFKETNSVFFYIEKITVSIFIIDYILRWITADFKYGKRRATSFVKYPFSFFAIIDLISILPSITVLNSGLKLFRLLRLNKVFRTLKVLRYSKSFNLIINVIAKESKVLLSVCYLAGGYIILSALIMFQVEPNSFDTFFDAIYWAVVTLTTVGYGDLYPSTDVGRVVSMLSSIMGIAIVALPTGIITAGYMNELNKKE